MRKYQQRQILEVLKTIEQAQSEGLYADCQKGAVSIGNFIEGIEGEGTRVVTLLEGYCELLFQASKGEIKEKKLKRHLIKIENCVEEELKPNRIEVAFFPYQYSMFDSLESIYLAAKNDPCCDAYVVPIPYYELNPDGTIGDMHYDGDQYPKDIPVTDWQEYAIEKRHPDIIFIHYAYDNNVSNASIHPAFYSARLREHCELLVYVPYFVSPGDAVEEYNGFLPGVINAHCVIVQSEAVRRSYIEQYKKFNKEPSGKVEEKFIVLGSPKYDKVINTRRENCELPSEWESLIYHSSGTRKKVILFNTHMFTWIRSGEQYFKKLRFVFDLFRNRDDVVLWWRPHPNTEVNFRTKRPNLLDNYYAVVNDFKREKWGIYDDTSDLHRAIACSDAYYGDVSSLIPMYHLTGKPIMLSNLDLLQSDNTFTPMVHNFVHYHDDELWFFEKRTDTHFKMSKAKWEPEFLGCLPGQRAYARQIPLYHRSCESNGHLYLAPYIAEEIAVYSIQGNIFETIPYKKVDRKTEFSGDFGAAIAYGDDVFFIPNAYPAIIHLNTVTKELTYHSDWIDQLANVIGHNPSPFFSYPLVVESSAFLVVLEANLVVEFNMEEYTFIIHEIGEKNYRYNGICFDGKHYWLSPLHNTPVVKWSPQTGEIKVFENLFLDDHEIQYAFHLIVYCNGYVWLLQNAAAHAIKIDIQTDTVTIADEFAFDYQGKDERLHHQYTLPIVSGDSIYTYNISKTTLVEYNCATKKRREEKILYPSVAEPFIAKALLINPDAIQTQGHCYYYESIQIQLRDFINFLAYYSDSEGATAIMRKRKEIIGSVNAYTDGTSGSKIYEYAKKEMLNRR